MHDHTEAVFDLVFPSLVSYFPPKRGAAAGSEEHAKEVWLDMRAQMLDWRVGEDVTESRWWAQEVRGSCSAAQSLGHHSVASLVRAPEGMVEVIGLQSTSCWGLPGFAGQKHSRS